MTREERKIKRQIEIRKLADRYLAKFESSINELVEDPTCSGKDVITNAFARTFELLQLNAKDDKTRVELYRDAGSLAIDKIVDSISQTAPTFFTDVEGLKTDLNKTLAGL